MSADSQCVCLEISGESRSGKGDVPAYPDRIQRHGLEAGLFVVARSHEQVPAHLHGVSVEVGVKDGALHVDESLHLCTGDRYRSFDLRGAKNEGPFGAKMIRRERAIQARSDNETSSSACAEPK